MYLTVLLRPLGEVVQPDALQQGTVAPQRSKDGNPCPARVDGGEPEQHPAEALAESEDEPQDGGLHNADPIQLELLQSRRKRLGGRQPVEEVHRQIHVAQIQGQLLQPRRVQDQLHQPVDDVRREGLLQREGLQMGGPRGVELGRASLLEAQPSRHYSAIARGRSSAEILEMERPDGQACVADEGEENGNHVCGPEGLEVQQVFPWTDCTPERSGSSPACAGEDGAASARQGLAAGMTDSPRDYVDARRIRVRYPSSRGRAACGPACEDAHSRRGLPALADSRVTSPSARWPDTCG